MLRVKAVKKGFHGSLRYIGEEFTVDAMPEGKCWYELADKQEAVPVERFETSTAEGCTPELAVAQIVTMRSVDTVSKFVEGDDNEVVQVAATEKIRSIKKGVALKQRAKRIKKQKGR